MAGKLPRAGFEATVEGLAKFKSDVDAYNKALGKAKTTTEAGAKSMTASAKKMAKSWDPFATTFEDVQRDVQQLGGSLEDLGGKTARLTVPVGATADSVRGLGGVLELAGYQVEVVEQKVESATGVFGTFRQSMLAMGSLRGGLMFRFLKGMGGTAATMAVAGYVAIRVGKAVRKAVTNIVDSVGELEKTRAAETAFKNLSRTAGISFGSITKDVRKATGYTLDEYAVWTKANKQLLAGFGEIAEAMPQLARTASALGNALGVDAAGMLDNLTGAIREADTEMLESEYGFEGLTLAVQDAARELGKNTDELDEQEKAHIVLQALLPQTEEMIRRVGGAAGGAAGQLRNFWGELWDTINAMSLAAAIPILGIFGADPDSITAVKERNLLVAETQLLLGQMRQEVLAGTIARDKAVEATERWRDIFGAPGGLLALAGWVPPEESREAMEAFIYSLKVMLGLVAEMEPWEGGLISPDVWMQQQESAKRWAEYVQQQQEEIAKAQEVINELTKEWERDIIAAQMEAGEVIDVDKAREQAAAMGEALLENITMAIEAGATLGELEIDALILLAEGGFDKLIAFMEARAESFIEGLVKRADAEFDKLGERAERKAITIAPYVTFEKYQEYSKAYYAALEAWYNEYAPNLWGAKAQYELSIINSRWEGIASNITRAGKGIGTSVSSMKRLADETLLASKALGAWATAFKAERGGRGVLAAYARHEEPLTAALIDKLWGEQFAREAGRPPTEEEWKAHWYAVWYPKELYHVPGAPIGAPTGPLAEGARKLLSEQGLLGLGDIYQDEYLQRKGLLGEMDKETSAREVLVEALDEMTAAVNAAKDAFTPPPTDEEDAAGEAAKAAVKTIAKELGAGWTGIPELQRGGLTRGAGLAWLHAGELIIPMNRLIDTVNMRMGGGDGGGLTIQSLSIPVTVGAGASATVARDVQSAVVHAIRGRAGTEMRRAARRRGR